MRMPGKIEMDVYAPYSVRPTVFHKEGIESHADKTAEQVLLDHFNENVCRRAKLVLMAEKRNVHRISRSVVEETLSEADMPLCAMQVHFVVKLDYDENISGIIHLKKQRIVLTYLLNIMPETCGLKYLGHRMLAENEVLTRRGDRICLDECFLPLIDDYKKLTGFFGITDDEECDDEFRGIPVIERYCPREYDNRGQMFLNGGYIPVLGRTEFIPGMFILVNMTLCTGKDDRRKTIAHEYVHCMIHVFHAYLQSMGDENYMTQYCFSNNFTVPQKIDGRTICEIQAWEITRRIMMPEDETIRIVENAIWRHGMRRTPAAMEEAVQAVKDRFHDTLEETRQWVIDLGYREAAGTFIFEDGKQIPSFGLSCEWNPGHEYTLSMEEYRKFMNEEEKFAELMKSGHYAIVENHICRKGLPYLRLNDRLEYEITDFGRTRINEFCMRFVVNILRAPEQGMTGSFNSRTPTQLKRKLPVCSSCPPVIDEKYLEKSNAEDEAWYDLMEDNTGENGNLFKLLEGIREKIGLSQDDVYSEMGITQRTYTNHLKLDDDVENDFIYAWIIAVQPPFWIRDRIITEYVSKPRKKRNVLIKTLMLTYEDLSLDFLNAKLVKSKQDKISYLTR